MAEYVSQFILELGISNSYLALIAKKYRREFEEEFKDLGQFSSYIYEQNKEDLMDFVIVKKEMDEDVITLKLLKAGDFGVFSKIFCMQNLIKMREWLQNEKNMSEALAMLDTCSLLYVLKTIEIRSSPINIKSPIGIFKYISKIITSIYEGKFCYYTYEIKNQIDELIEDHGLTYLYYSLKNNQIKYEIIDYLAKYITIPLYDEHHKEFSELIRFIPRMGVIIKQKAEELGMKLVSVEDMMEHPKIKKYDLGPDLLRVMFGSEYYFDTPERLEIIIGMVSEQISKATLNSLSS